MWPKNNPVVAIKLLIPVVCSLLAPCSGFSKGLAYLRVTMGSGMGGTDDNVRVQLSGGKNGQTCTTKAIYTGFFVDSWSPGDTEVYRSDGQDFGDCTEFEVTESNVSFNIQKDGTDSLVLTKVEFEIGNQTYVWSGHAEWNPNHLPVTAFCTNCRPDCSCSDLMSKSGTAGQCKKATGSKFGGAVWCYVNKPSSCSDIIASSDHPGEGYSAEACKDVKADASVPATCSSSSPQYIPDPTDCQVYYQCTAGHAPARHTCPGASRWSTTINNCDQADNVPCPRTGQSSVDGIECASNKSSSKAPHPDSCEYYFQCYNGVITEKSKHYMCFSKQKYDEKRGDCVPKDKWKKEDNLICHTGCNMETGVYTSGFYLEKDLETSGKDECSSLCASTAGCEAWNFRKKDNYCWLLADDTGRSDEYDLSEGWITGTNKCGDKKDQTETKEGTFTITYTMGLIIGVSVTSLIVGSAITWRWCTRDKKGAANNSTEEDPGVIIIKDKDGKVLSDEYIRSCCGILLDRESSSGQFLAQLKRYHGTEIIERVEENEEYGYAYGLCDYETGEIVDYNVGYHAAEDSDSDGESVAEIKDANTMYGRASTSS